MPFDGRNFEQNDEVLERLRHGRALVARPDGWVQQFFRRDDAVCAVGAIGGFHYGQHSPAICYLYRALPLLWRLYGRREAMERWEVVVRFNDYRRRRQAQIVALFDRAIALREKEGGARG